MKAQSLSPIPPPDALEAQPRRRRQLRNLLIDRSYQLRFTLAIAGVAASLTACLGALVYHALREASQVVALRMLDPTDLEATALQQQLLRNDRLLLAGLFGFGVVLVVLIAGYGVLMTHKVAGPLFKISRHMNLIRDGRLARLDDLRKGDELTEFFATFRGMHEALGRGAVDEAALLEQLAAELEWGGQRPAADRLRELARRKRAFVEGA